MMETQQKEIDVTATEASETSEPAGGSGSSHKSLSVTTGNAQTPRKNAPDGDKDTHKGGAQDTKFNTPTASSQNPEVITVDIDEDKIIMAKQNARIYGVLEKIEFVVGDFFKLANQIKGDVIVTSPPWGGPEYNKMDVIGPLDLCVDKILEVGKTIAPKILLHLPKNLDKNECWKMCNGVGAGLRKIENVFMDRYLNSTLLYVRSNNNNAVTDVAPKPVDIHLHHSFRRNERYSLETYRRYLMDVDALVSSRRTSL